MGLLIYLKVDTSTPAWIFLNLVSGVGTGVLFSAMAIAVQASSSNEDVSDLVDQISPRPVFFHLFHIVISIEPRRHSSGVSVRYDCEMR